MNKLTRLIRLIKDKLDLIEAVAGKYPEISEEERLLLGIEGLLVGDRLYRKNKRHKDAAKGKKFLHHEHYVTYLIKRKIEDEIEKKKLSS